MRKSIVQLILFSSIVIYLISCSSSDNDKYNRLTKNDRKNIDSFCICADPYIIFLNKTQNLNDSAEALKNIDSISIILKNFAACIDILSNIHPDKEFEKEFNKEMLEYTKNKYPDCYAFLMDKKSKKSNDDKK